MFVRGLGSQPNANHKRVKHSNGTWITEWALLVQYLAYLLKSVGTLFFGQRKWNQKYSRGFFLS